MTTLAARQETLRLIDALPDSKIQSALRFVRGLSATEQKPRKRTLTANKTQPATPKKRKQLSEKQMAQIHAAIDEAAGMWCWHNDPRTPDEIARDLRRGRQFDIR